MTTRINVNVSGFDAAALKQKADADIQARRVTYVEKTRLQETQRRAEELREIDKRNNNIISRNGLPLKKAEISVARRKPVYRKEELAAMILDESLSGVSQVLIAYFNRTTGNNFWQIWPIEQNVTFEEEAPYQEIDGYEVSPYRAWFILPVEKETCIAVIYGNRSGGGFEVDHRLRVYAVGKNKLRLLTPPAKITTIVDLLNNGAYDRVDQINGVDVGPYAPRHIENTAAGWLYNESFNREFTPTIYELLNRLSPFVSASAIKQFPEGKKPLTYDLRSGYYLSTTGANSGSDRSLYYAEWTGDSGGIITPQTNPELLISRPDLTTVLPGDFEIVNPDADIITAWDWDDPAYCRRMCLALGFSDADLRP